MTDSPGRLFTPAYLALTASDLAYFTATGVLIGVTPFFVTGPLGSDKAGLGLALGAFSATSVVVRPVVGRLVDRWGRRRFMLAGVGLFAVAVAAHLVVTQLATLVVLRLVMGIAESLFFVAGFAVLADLAPPDRMGEALSWSSVALYLGIAVGPGIGQLLLDWRGFAAAWLGATLLVLAAAALVWTLPETGTPAPADSDPAPLIHRAALRPGVALFTGVAGAGGFLALVGLHATEIGFPAWSVVPLIYGSVVVVCRIAFARVPDQLPPLRLAGSSLVVCALGLAVLGIVRSPVGLVTGAVVLGLGAAFLTPAIFAAIFSIVPPSERGAASGTATLFIDLGIGGGPLLLGITASAAGIPVAFALGAALTASGAALLLSSRTLRRVESPAGSTP